MTDAQTVLIEHHDIVVVSVGQQGPPGIPGTPWGELVYTAGIDLSGHRAVILDSSGQAVYADNTIPWHGLATVGITTAAAISGGQAPVTFSGEVVEPTWSWAANSPVYLGANGFLTQTPPVAPAAFVLIVGFPTAPTKLFVGIKSPIYF